MPPVHGLTEKQARFVYHWLDDPNAIQAAIKAGFSPRTAYSIGCENLTKPDIMEAINEKKRKIYDEDKLRERLTDVIDSPDNQTILVQAIRVGMLEKAMLTERNINENLNKNVSDESLDPSVVATEALRMLRESDQAGAKLAQVVDVARSPQVIDVKADTPI